MGIYLQYYTMFFQDSMANDPAMFLVKICLQWSKVEQVIRQDWRVLPLIHNWATTVAEAGAKGQKFKVAVA